MRTQQIEQLHESAALSYVEGRYDEARRVWESILLHAPADARALDGVQLIGALEHPAGSAGSPARTPTPGAVMSIEEIETLVSQGRYREALEGARALGGDAPADARLAALMARALAKVEAEPFILGELDAAQAALAEGAITQALEGCERVLALDPECLDALTLLAHIDAASARIEAERATQPPQNFAPRTSGAPAPARAADTAPPPAPPPTMPAPPVASSAVHGARQTEAATQATPTAEAPADPMSMAMPDITDEPEDQPFTMPPIADVEAMNLDVTAGMVSSPDFTPGSLFEAPEHEIESLSLAPPDNLPPASAPSAMSVGPAGAGSFDELEAEMNESATSAPRQAEGRAEATARGTEDSKENAFTDAANNPLAAGGHTVAGGAPAPAPADDDLSFGEEFADLEADAPAAPPATAIAPEARIAEYIAEAKRFLQAARYSDAIETAARAFAIDPEAPGASEVIEEARARQDDSDRRAEEIMDEARRKLEAGDTEESEALYRQVLQTHPSHREALDGIERATKKRREAQSHVSARPGTREEFQAPRPPEIMPREPLTPKAPGMEDEIAPRVMARPEQAVRPQAKPKPKMSRKRLLTIGGIGLAVVVVALGGLYLVGRAAMNVVLPDPGGPTKSTASSTPTSTTTARPPRPAGKGTGKAAIAKKPTVAPEPTPLDRASGVARTLPAAKQLASVGKLDEARVVLLDILKATPTDVQASSMLESVEARIGTRDELNRMLSGIRTAFSQENYEDALRMLYRLPPEIQKGDVELMKANAWFNNGVGYLAGGNCTEAIRCFDETLGLNPRIGEARKLREFARSYQARAKDSSYLRIVRNLPTRAIDEK